MFFYGFLKYKHSFFQLFAFKPFSVIPHQPLFSYLLLTNFQLFLINPFSVTPNQPLFSYLLFKTFQLFINHRGSNQRRIASYEFKGP
jgi:hypothetical protein